eukprot:719131-Karenia_brevis.AAC.1
MGYIAQWLERLTADHQVPGSNPGVPSPFLSAAFGTRRKCAYAMLVLARKGPQAVLWPKEFISARFRHTPAEWRSG